jgi:type II secretory pathway pseudopilin PulG
MRAPAMQLRDERGETLVELIIAIAILGVAGVAILAGMAFNVQASTINRNQAGGGAYLRSGAEAIQKGIDRSGTYASCAGALTTYTSAASSVISSTDVSEGYVIKVLGQPNSWVKVGGVPQWSSCDNAADGIQRIKLELTTPGDAAHGAVETMYVVLRKPCDSAGANPCA